MKKRLVAGLAALSMLAYLAACGGGTTPTGGQANTGNGETNANETTEPGGDSDLEPYNLVYQVISNSVSGEVATIEEAINELIEPLINATVTINMVTYADWAERAIVPIQSGEKVDLTFTADWQNYVRSISQNLFTPLNDPGSSVGDLLNTYAAEAVELLGEGFVLGAQVDGINYAVPTNKELTIPGGFVYNEDLVEKYNVDITAIKTVHDLVPILEEVKAGEGDNFYPYLTAGTHYMLPYAGAASNVPEAVFYTGYLGDSVDDLEIYSYWEEDYIMEFYERIREFYVAGYIHPDSYLSTYQYNDFLNAGDWFVTSQPLKGNTAKTDELEAASGNPNLKLAEQQIQDNWQFTNDAGGSMLAIPTTSEDPARAMMFINLMHTNADVTNTMTYGVEDVHYTFVEDGIVSINEDRNWNGAHAGNWIMGNQFIQYVSENEDPDKFVLMQEFSEQGLPHPSLGFRFDLTPVENEIAALTNVKQGIEQSIRTGAVDPTVEIPNLVEQMKAAGLEDVIEEVRTQFTTWYDSVHGE